MNTYIDFALVRAAKGCELKPTNIKENVLWLKVDDEDVRVCKNKNGIRISCSCRWCSIKGIRYNSNCRRIIAVWGYLSQKEGRIDLFDLESNIIPYPKG